MKLRDTWFEVINWNKMIRDGFECRTFISVITLNNSANKSDNVASPGRIISKKLTLTPLTWRIW
jgi:hypothetical protein